MCGLFGEVRWLAVWLCWCRCSILRSGQSLGVPVGTTMLLRLFPGKGQMRGRGLWSGLWCGLVGGVCGCSILW